jgi:hypothetical protein
VTRAPYEKQGPGVIIMASEAPPAGYDYVPVPGALAMARLDVAQAVGHVLRAGTLERWAAGHPERREMRGRGAVYAVPLPDGGPRVVVRHARHGGLLASITGDRFLGLGRAPRELRIALRLAASGVPTPPVVAYALYGAGRLLTRADVVTEEIVGGLDLPDALARWPEARGALLAAVATRLGRLARAGARHPDLNVKNVLLTRPAGADPVAYVLDVDRIVFEAPGARVAAANVARLARSARKWAARGTPLLGAAEIAALAAAGGRA